MLLYSLLYIYEISVVIDHNYTSRVKDQDGISATQNLLPFTHSQYLNGVLLAIRGRTRYYIWVI